MEATLLTLGVLLILVGLIGQVKAKEIEVGTKNPLVRVILGLIGAVFVSTALGIPLPFPPTETPAATSAPPVPTTIAPASDMPTATSAPPVPNTIAPASDTPTATSAPPVPTTIAPAIDTSTPELRPDLFISEFSLDPSTPSQGSPVSVRVGVYNQGTGKAGAFTAQWWAGENYAAPACTWRVESMVARGGIILTCTYDGYPSWYGSITTKAEADSDGEVAESDEENNTERMTISVGRPSTFRVAFDSYPDGTPITTDRILEGDEFLDMGIRLVGAPESSYCADATVAAIRRPGLSGDITFNYLTSASPGNIKRCNTIPVAIIFISPVRQVTLTFAGASVTYTLKAYDSGGRLLGTAQEDAVWNGGTFEVLFSSESSNISRVTFGSQTAVTAIKEIYYER